MKTIAEVLAEIDRLAILAKESYIINGSETRMYFAGKHAGMMELKNFISPFPKKGCDHVYVDDMRCGNVVGKMCKFCKEPLI